MRLLQINTTLNSGSTGRIAEDIGKVVMQQGHESYIAYGRSNLTSASKAIKIGNAFDIRLHGLKTRLFDLHGFGSKNATQQFVESLKEINPDIIHLHNIHGYYLNVEVFFKSLKQANKPVVWTFHDCWPFTGHCSHFDFVNCFKWETQCFNCPNQRAYPASWFVDNSKQNYPRKKELFTGLQNLTIITPSTWLENHVKSSFLSGYPAQTIYNGIDLAVFSPTNNPPALRQLGIESESYILGVANVWTHKKGLKDFFHLREVLSADIQIVLVGLNSSQMKPLPKGIKGIARTESIQVLAAIYSAASVFVNPTYVDNFPTTNIEALACGTPLVTYNTGGSPEAIDEHTGLVVGKGDIKGLAKAIEQIIHKGKDHYRSLCRERAERLFNKEDQFFEYLEIYKKLFFM